MSDGVQKGTLLPGGAVVEDLIAEGRLCTVYRVHLPSGGVAAARMLRADLSKDLGEWFLETAARRATLDHPVIPKVFATGVIHERPVEVTQLLIGRTAQDLIDQGQNGLDVPTAVRILRSIAAGIDHLHATTPPWLHRALLPEHVLIRDDDGAVMLLGVGEAERPRISVIRPAYLSPEELADVSSLSPRADVFSLATLTYELFTGRPAFVGGGDGVLDYVRMARFPRLREHRPDLHARAEHVLREAWSLTPDDRPLSAGRFASLFADAVNQQAHTLVNIPAAPAPEPQPKLTLNGPGPLDVATRRALRDERPPAPRSSEGEGEGDPTPRIPATNPRAPRGVRGTSQRPRAFLPKPGDVPDEATRPEISVPSEVRDGDNVPPADETPVEGTASPRPVTPRFQKTTPGIVSPMPSAPLAVHAPPATEAPISSAEAPSPPAVSSPSSESSATTPTGPELPARADPRSAPTQAFATLSPVTDDRPQATPASPSGPLSGSHFEPHHQPPPQLAPAPISQSSPASSEPAMSVAVPYTPPPPPPPASEPSPYGDFYAPTPDERTQIIDVPTPAPTASRWSPIVVAAALIANAIAIAGISHAIAWVQLSRAAPTIVQTPAPVCAPCGRCPPAPVCPPGAVEPLPAAPRLPTRASLTPHPALRPAPGR